MMEYQNDGTQSQILGVLSGIQSTMSQMLGVVSSGASGAFNYVSGQASNLGGAIGGFHQAAHPVGIGGGIVLQQPGILGGMLQGSGISSPPVYMTPQEYQSMGIEAAGTRMLRGTVGAGAMAASSLGLMAAFDLGGAAITAATSGVGAAAQGLKYTTTGLLGQGLVKGLEFAGGTTVANAGLLGTVASGMGGILSGAAGLATSIAPFLVAGEVASGAYESLQTNWAIQDNLQRNSSRYFRGNQGRGFTIDQRQDAARFIQQLGLQEMTAGGEMGGEDIQKMMNMPGFNTFMTGIRGMDEFKARMKELVKNVKEVAITLNESVEQAAQTTMELRRLGYSSPGAINGVVQNIKGAALSSGFTSQEVLGFAANAGQQLRGTAFSQSIAANATTQALPMISTAIEQGLISQDIVANMGGMQGLSGAVAQHATNALVNDQTLKNLSAAAFNAQTGKLDMDLVKSFLSGGQSAEQLAIQAAANTATPQARMAFEMARPEITKQMSNLAMPLIMRTAVEEASIISRNTGMDLDTAMYTAIQQKTGGNEALTQTYMAMYKEGPQGIERQIGIMEQENRRSEAKRIHDKYSLSGKMYRGFETVKETVAHPFVSGYNYGAKKLQEFDDWWTGLERYNEPEFLGDIQRMNEISREAMGYRIPDLTPEAERTSQTVAGLAPKIEQGEARRSSEAEAARRAELFKETTPLDAISNRPLRDFTEGSGAFNKFAPAVIGNTFGTAAAVRTVAALPRAATMARLMYFAGESAVAGTSAAAGIIATPITLALAGTAAVLGGVSMYQNGMLGRSETLENLMPAIFTQRLQAGQVDEIMSGTDYWQRMYETYGFSPRTATLPELQTRKVMALSGVAQEGSKLITESEYNRMSDTEKQKYIATASESTRTLSNEERREKNLALALDELPRTSAEAVQGAQDPTKPMDKRDPSGWRAVTGKATTPEEEMGKRYLNMANFITKQADMANDIDTTRTTELEFAVKNGTATQEQRDELHQIQVREGQLQTAKNRIETVMKEAESGKTFTEGDRKNLNEDIKTATRLLQTVPGMENVTADLRKAGGLANVQATEDKERMFKLDKVESLDKAVEMTNKAISVAKGPLQKDIDVYTKYSGVLKEDKALQDSIEKRFAAGKGSYDSSDVAVVTDDVAASLLKSGKIGGTSSLNLAEKVSATFGQSVEGGLKAIESARGKDSEWSFITDADMKSLRKAERPEERLDIIRSAQQRQAYELATPIAGVMINAKMGTAAAQNLDMIQQFRGTSWKDLMNARSERDAAITKFADAKFGKVEESRRGAVAKAAASVLALSAKGIKVTDDDIKKELMNSYTTDKDKANTAKIDDDIRTIKAQIQGDLTDEKEVARRISQRMSGTIDNEKANISVAKAADVKRMAEILQKASGSTEALPTDYEGLKSYVEQNASAASKALSGNAIDDKEKEFITTFLAPTSGMTRGSDEVKNFNALTAMTGGQIDQITRIEKIKKDVSPAFEKFWKDNRESVETKWSAALGGKKADESVVASIGALHSISEDDIRRLSPENRANIENVFKYMDDNKISMADAKRQGLFGKADQLMGLMRVARDVRTAESVSGDQAAEFYKAFSGKDLDSETASKMFKGYDEAKKKAMSDLEKRTDLNEAQKTVEAHRIALTQVSAEGKKVSDAVGTQEQIQEMANNMAMNLEAVSAARPGENINQPGGSTPGAGDKVMDNWVTAMRELATFMQTLKK